MYLHEEVSGAPGATRGKSVTQELLGWARVAQGKVMTRHRPLVGRQQLHGHDVTQQERRQESEWCAADPLLQDGADLIHGNRD